MCLQLLLQIYLAITDIANHGFIESGLMFEGIFIDVSHSIEFSHPFLLTTSPPTGFANTSPRKWNHILQETGATDLDYWDLAANLFQRCTPLLLFNQDVSLDTLCYKLQKLRPVTSEQGSVTNVLLRSLSSELYKQCVTTSKCATTSSNALHPRTRSKSISSTRPISRENK